jgi:glutathione synthase/RimK-type ligase-like ATP-grasp enzyme
MVLVCGNPADEVIRWLCSRLRVLNIDHRMWNLDESSTGYSIECDSPDDVRTGTMSNIVWAFTAEELTGVYFRNSSWNARKSSGPIGHIYPRTSPDVRVLLNGLPCRVVNRPESAGSNRSKPYQALIIRRCGFEIPKTLVTNDPREVHTFYAECNGEVVFKSISGVRSAVRRMTRQHFERLVLLEKCPTQFQEFLSGDNIRVHVIGERLFAVRIQCEAIDYRYAGQEGYSRTMVPATLPEDVASKCIRLTKELGLAMSGIDLKETSMGEYFCFEINASPAFPFYESAAQPVIADALAEFLAERNS